MLSNLRPSQSSSILQHMLDIRNGKNGEMWEHFRGAFGPTQVKQTEMYEEGVKGMRKTRDEAMEQADVEERETASEHCLQAVHLPCDCLTRGPIAISPTARARLQGVRSYSTRTSSSRLYSTATYPSLLRRSHSSRRSYSSTTQNTRPNEQEDSRDNDNQNQHGPEQPKAQTISQKLKELFTKYGRYAFVMYWVLSAADFSVAFLGVHLIGADKLLPIKDWVVVQWHKIRPPPEEEKSVLDRATETAEHVAHAVTDAVVTGKQAEEKKAQQGNSLLWAEAALAYTIHKIIFLPVRVGLTAAWTPKFVKWLTARGWVGKASGLS